ncbi:hypothetical protein [Thermoflexus hugenholtzii]|uniref:hypothetical protein n=1 Tax=Thermoflexus hugenholtzii TaxID=1495650 RepID=UPI000B501390|nr:hypothetical protein [Thermoflexus hugenholtzii]
MIPKTRRVSLLHRLSFPIADEILLLGDQHLDCLRFQAHPAEDLGQLVVGLGPEVRELASEPFEAPPGIHRGSIAGEPFVFQAVDPELAPLRPAAFIVHDHPEPGVLKVKASVQL